MAVLYWFAGGWARRYPGVAPMLLGGLVLVVTTIASCRPNGPGPALLAFAVAVSVCLGWLGYKVQRRRPRGSPAEMLLATLAAPVPSAQAVQPEDVLGKWQFYVDAATSTVTVDLQPDGRYTQVILGNRGQRIDCPGGTWTLEGPYVELNSYRSAVRVMMDRVRWFFGNWKKDLVLFAKDDPQAEATLLGRKVTARAMP